MVVVYFLSKKSFDAGNRVGRGGSSPPPPRRAGLWSPSSNCTEVYTGRRGWKNTQTYFCTLGQLVSFYLLRPNKGKPTKAENPIPLSPPSPPSRRPCPLVSRETRCLLTPPARRVVSPSPVPRPAGPASRSLPRPRQALPPALPPAPPLRSPSQARRRRAAQARARRIPDFLRCTELGKVAELMVKTGMSNYKLVYRLIELILIPSVATASVERIFSAMSIIKTDLQK
jgi:hypothetical protein